MPNLFYNTEMAFTIKTMAIEAVTICLLTLSYGGGSRLEHSSSQVVTPFVFIGVGPLIQFLKNYQEIRDLFIS